MQPPQTFHALLGESQHLFFFICAAQEEFTEGYGALLEQLYQMKRDAVEEECAYFIFSGSPAKIIDIFNECNGIKENRLERIAYILSEISKIFAGQTEVPFMYIDGQEENIDRHFELVKQIVPKHNSEGTITEV
jgi:hypothetical protein